SARAIWASRSSRSTKACRSSSKNCRNRLEATLTRDGSGADMRAWYASRMLHVVTLLGLGLAAGLVHLGGCARTPKPGPDAVAEPRGPAGERAASRPRVPRPLLRRHAAARREGLVPRAPRRRAAAVGRRAREDLRADARRSRSRGRLLDPVPQRPHRAGHHAG